MKFCINCKHYLNDPTTGLWGCWHEKNLHMSVIIGKQIPRRTVEFLRYGNQYGEPLEAICRGTGNWWESRPNAAARELAGR